MLPAALQSANESATVSRQRASAANTSPSRSGKRSPPPDSQTSEVVPATPSRSIRHAAGSPGTGSPAGGSKAGTPMSGPAWGAHPAAGGRRRADGRAGAGGSGSGTGGGGG